jgi:hypothetical protein
MTSLAVRRPHHGDLNRANASVALAPNPFWGLYQPGADCRIERERRCDHDFTGRPNGGDV